MFLPSNTHVCVRIMKTVCDMHLKQFEEICKVNTETTTYISICLFVLYSFFQNEYEEAELQSF